MLPKLPRPYDPAREMNRWKNYHTPPFGESPPDGLTWDDVEAIIADAEPIFERETLERCLPKRPAMLFDGHLFRSMDGRSLYSSSLRLMSQLMDQQTDRLRERLDGDA